MKDITKAVDALALGFNKALQEWVNSCLLGALFIAVIVVTTAFFVIVNYGLPHIGAFQR